ncbi:class C sortase [Macrococcoides canis]|uniref:class C sortase n=1 Tax=Macrococcoides canis TaxID=1855823 RepID=UPI00165D9397|nr:class C sortase [Macrococcus canis]
MKKIFIIFIFLIGFIVALYPQFTKIYYNYNMQSKSLEVEEEFIKNKGNLKQYVYQKEINDSLVRNQIAIKPPPVENNSANTTITDFSNEKIIATIKIPKLKIHYPILDGATPENLNKGVSRVEGTSYPIGGKSTNSVLAAHSYSPFNEWFTNIDKLDVGDAIIINNAKEQIIYKVVNQRIVNPAQTDAIEIIKGKDMVTLLTCTPSGAERILIYAERDSADFKAEAIQKDKKQYSIYEILKVLSDSWIIILISIALLIMFIKKILDANQ